MFLVRIVLESTVLESVIFLSDLLQGAQPSKKETAPKDLQSAGAHSTQVDTS